jgi:hypothetical protein
MIPEIVIERSGDRHFVFKKLDQLRASSVPGLNPAVLAAVDVPIRAQNLS